MTAGHRADYQRAESVDHALELLETHPGAELLAGGHDLFARINDGLAAPPMVVDVGDIGAIQGVEIDGQTANIGALTAYTTVLGSDSLREGATALTEAVKAIGDRQIRNGGTIGANIVDPDPVADPPAAVIASDATLVVRGLDGDRRIDATEFFAGRATAVADDELLTRIEVPLGNRATVGTYVKTQRRTARYSLLGVAARVEFESGPGGTDGQSGNGTVSRASVAANGAVRNGVRLDRVERTLEGTKLDRDSIRTAAAEAGADLDESAFLDTREASAPYRAKLLRVYTERALERVAERAGVRVDG